MPSRTELRRLFFTACLTYGVCYPPVASTVLAQDSLLPTLHAIRAAYPTPMAAEQIGELLTRTAASAPGWGLLKKDTGARCPTPMGVTVACDYLVWMPTGQGYDVLLDAEGQGIPTWNRGDVFPPDRAIVPRVAPDPAPSDPPVADDPSHDLILDALAQLEQRQSELQALIEREAAALRAEHAQAAEHHETDDDKPGSSSKADLILSTLAAIGAAVAAALGAQ